MMWDEVMSRINTEILADSTLSTIFGTEFKAAGTGVLSVPSLEWMLVGDREDELWAPMIVQFDIWVKTASSARVAERRLRELYHRDLPRYLGDIQMWTVYSDGSWLASPDRAQHTGRAVRFTFTPLREKYALPSGILLPPGEILQDVIIDGGEPPGDEEEDEIIIDGGDL